MKAPAPLLLCVLLAGCVAPKMNTSSGSPEVTINAPKQKVKAALVNQLANDHFAAVQDTDFILVAEAPASAMQNFWFADMYGGQSAKLRERFTFVETDGKTRVIGTPKFMGAGAFGGLNEQDYSSMRPYQLMQWRLDCLKADLEGTIPPAQPDPPKTVPISAPKG